MVKINVTQLKTHVEGLHFRQNAKLVFQEVRQL